MDFLLLTCKETLQFFCRNWILLFEHWYRNGVHLSLSTLTWLSLSHLFDLTLSLGNACWREELPYILLLPVRTVIFLFIYNIFTCFTQIGCLNFIINVIAVIIFPWLDWNGNKSFLEIIYIWFPLKMMLIFFIYTSSPGHIKRLPDERGGNKWSVPLSDFHTTHLNNNKYFIISRLPCEQ